MISFPQDLEDQGHNTRCACVLRTWQVRLCPAEVKNLREEPLDEDKETEHGASVMFLAVLTMRGHICKRIKAAKLPIGM